MSRDGKELRLVIESGIQKGANVGKVIKDFEILISTRGFW